MTQPPRELLDALLAQLDVGDDLGSDTDPGPAPLAGLWEGELDADLTEPVIRQIRFDQFVREVVSLGADIAMRMGRAAVAYSVGAEPRDDDERSDGEAPTDSDEPANDNGEE